MKKATHPFERTIGDGPYKFVRVVRIIVAEGVGARIVGYADDVEFGIGTCAHCGMAIMNCFIVSRGDGKKFGVGSDCIRKSTLPFDVKSAAEKARKQHDREVRAARAEKKRLAEGEAFAKAVADLRAALAADPSLFTNEPHPHEYFASQGKSMRDYVEYGAKTMSRSIVMNALKRCVAKKT